MNQPHQYPSTTVTGRACPEPHPRFCHRRHEQGTALIMSLVILLILTILGVTAMSTSSLQEKMAGNLQDTVRAIEVAESGASQALAMSPPPLPPAFAGSSSSLGTIYSNGTGSQRLTADVTINYIDKASIRSTNPGIFSSSFEFAHYDVVSTGTTGTGTRGIAHQGVRVLLAPGS